MSQADSPRGSLPYGWQVKTSKRYPDRIYYFNVFTGSSTWECPVLNPPRELSREAGLPVKTMETSAKKVSQALPVKPSQVPEKMRKCNPSVTPNSQKRLSDHSPFCAPDDSSKTSVPPTAVVVPVVHKQNVNFKLLSKPSISGNASANKVDDKVEKSSLKRKSDTLNASPVSTVQKMVKIQAPFNIRQRVSPLNRTYLKKINCTDKKVVKKFKKLSDNSSGKSSREAESKVIEISSESSSDEKKEINDIEMQDVSMDLDDLTAKKETVFDPCASYYVVMDTNVLISELHLINELKDTPMNGCGAPHIFIPWIVIRELDKLKSNRNSTKTAMRGSAEAIRYLNSVLGKHPRFHGQSPAEAEAWAKTYSRCNDDKILECCEGLSNKMPREKVILLTNDKNLVNKARICNIIVHNWQSMMESVKPNVTFNFTKEDKRKKSPETESTDAVNTKDQEEKVLQFKRDGYKLEIHTLMCTARQLLKNALAKLLEEEMFKAYGKLWHTFSIQKNLLEGIIQGILRYWVVAFAEIMTKKDKRNLQLLHAKAVRPEGFLADKDECLLILSTIEAVFCQIHKERPHITVHVEKIKEFRVMCVEAFYKYCDVENTIRTVEDTSTLAIFENNWTAANNLCGMLLDHFQFPHEFQYTKPSQIPSDAELRALLCDLLPSVQLLKTTMFSVLDAVRKSLPAKVSCKKLCNVLLQFIPSLKIKYIPITYPGFSAKALERFCTHPENRETIEIGYKQIVRFHTKLDEVLNKLMSEQFRRKSISPDRMMCD